MIRDFGDIDIVRMSGWLDVDDNWLRHVFEYDFGCGCRPGSYDRQVDPTECDIWKTLQAKLKAEYEFSRAEKEYEVAVKKHEGISL
jgi:hypothetical protein